MATRFILKREKVEIIKTMVGEEGKEEEVEKEEITEEEIGRGRVLGLKKQKEEIKEIKEGEDFGLQLETRADVQVGDIIEVINKAD